MNNVTRRLAAPALAAVFGLAAGAAPAIAQSDAAAPPRATAEDPASRKREVDALVQSAAGLYRQRKFDEALAECAKASALAPDDYRPHALEGYAYMAERKPENASKAFAAAIRAEPRKKELYLLEATADAGRGAEDEAVAACRKALEIDPSFAAAHGMIGEALRWDEKRRDEAIAAYRSALRLDPSLLAVYEPLGDLLVETKDAKGAEETFRAGIAADPAHMTARFSLGRLLVKQKRLVEAREVWNGRTSDTDNTHPNFIELLERAETLERATDALAAKPNDPETLVAMGLAVMEGDSWVVDGRQQRAIVYFERALAANPAYARAQYGICKAYVEIAAFERDKATVVDRELAKLRRLDAALADEVEAYRKEYVGGIPGGVAGTAQ
jgi:tetratricopeptide (TPR) repeat protein